VILLESLRFKPEIWPLFRKIIADVWEGRRQQHQDTLKLTDKRIAELQARKQKLIDAVVNGILPKPYFDEQMADVEADLAATKVPIGETVPERDELDRLLWFSEFFLQNAGSVWLGAEYDQKTRIQTAIFPQSVSATRDGFQTRARSCVLIDLQTPTEDESSLASPGGFEPPLPP
jgi:hypothetical protein